MTSEILFQENTEIDSIQQMITTIHNHIAEYRSNLSRRPNVYRPKIAELQANLAQIYWYDYKDYHSAEKLFLQALENYEKYSGRRIIIQSHKLKIMDFLVNLYNRSNRLELSEQILLRMLEIQKRLAENYWWIYLEDVAITQWRLRQSICRHATLQFGGTAVFGQSGYPIRIRPGRYIPVSSCNGTMPAKPGKTL